MVEIGSLYVAAVGGCSLVCCLPCVVSLLSLKGCPYLALYMQPGRVYMSCLVLQVMASWASFGPPGGPPNMSSAEPHRVR